MTHFSIKPLALTALLLACGAAVHADSGRASVPLLPKYQQECAACHIAYPPGMLPAASWRRQISTLDKHYGTDASLDEASVRDIGTWLQANAGTYKRVSEEPSQDRISQSAWFVRKHREVAPQIWKQAAVKSAANCAACHTRARTRAVFANPKSLSPKAWMRAFAAIGRIEPERTQ